MTLFSIGHSTHSIDEFVGRCRHDGIRTIYDIRSHPTSNTAPQFKRENLERWLPAHDIGYLWIPQLGGWAERHAEDPQLRTWAEERGVKISAYARGYFPKQRIGAQVEAKYNGKPTWTNQGLLDYSWYTATDEFAEGIELVMASELRRPAFMCAEFLPWKCHRSMVADYIAQVCGQFVWHVQPKLNGHNTWGTLQHRLQRYPAEVQAVWAQRRANVHAPIQ